jgi:hypothetical protein
MLDRRANLDAEVESVPLTLSAGAEDQKLPADAASEQRGVGSAGVAVSFVIIAVLVGSLAYSMYLNRNYLFPLSHLGGFLTFHMTPIDLSGLPQAVVATLQVLVLGTVAVRTILPPKRGRALPRLLLKIASVGTGAAFVGAAATILALFQVFTLVTTEAFVLGMIGAFAFLSWRRSGPSGFRRWVGSIADVWKVEMGDLTLPEKAVLAVVGVVALFVYYDSIFYPIVETDSIIYHSSMAAIAFYNHGLPLIVGGGVGLGTSANYPLLFSYLGTYYYVLMGQVQDTSLKILAPTAWLLTVLATFMIGRTLGGNLPGTGGSKQKVGTAVGAIAALLTLCVPSFLSYADQSTDETTVTFFLAFGFLFLINALENLDDRGYFIVAGVAFGAACLTTYQALYFVIPLFLVVAASSLRGKLPFFKRSITRNGLILLGTMTLVGCAPYVRNIIVFRDPIYPFFAEVFPVRDYSSWLFAQTAESWKSVALFLVSPQSPTTTGFWTHLVSYQSFYPLNPLLIIPAVLAFPLVFLRQRPALLAFIIIPSVFILFLLTPFVRYFWLVLPYAAIAVAAMLSAAQSTIDRWLRASSGSNVRRSRLSPSSGISRKIPRFVVPVCLALMLVFPSMAIFGNNNYTFIPFQSSYTPQQFFTYFDHPGISASIVLTNDYGSDVGAWSWLDSHYTSGRVATFESRIYYMPFSLKDPNAIYSLDALYALPLYFMSNGTGIAHYMQSQNISYIFVRSQDWGTSQFDELSFSTLLGSPYFPLLFTDGASDIFGVGPGSIRPDPIIAHTGDYVYDYGLSNASVVDGQEAKSVPMNDTSPRLFVETDNDLVSLTITYLNSGHGSLALNAFDPTTNTWVYGASVQKTDTGTWENYSTIVPTNLIDPYTEFGLFAANGDFAISQITATTVNQSGRSTIDGADGISISNATIPKSMIVYLPLLNPSEIVSIVSSTHRYNVSLEVFQGFTPLNVTTKWWLDQTNEIRVPANTTMTQVTSPSLSWRPSTSGYYTLIIVSWDPQVTSDINIQLSVAIGSSTSTPPSNVPFG